MKLSPTRRRGIVLISIVFLTILIGMYVTATHVMSRGQMMATLNSKESQLAESAARSGIEYALARLEENADWRGDENKVVVNTPELVVVEDSGNVIGLLTAKDGSRAQFRLRFNYQDGAAGGDGLADPRGDLWIDNPHVSFNNLLGTQDVPLPLADGRGYSVRSSVVDHRVPANSVALVCEGRVAPEFSQATASEPNPKVSYAQASRVVEGVYRVKEVTGERPVEPAVTMAARSMNVELFDGDSGNPAKLSIADSTGEGQPKTRSREGFQVHNKDGSLGEVEGRDATVMVTNPSDLRARLGRGVSAGVEDPNVAFYELAWNQVNHGSSRPEALKAGVYVYWESDQSLHYYPKDYENYMSDIKTDPLNPGLPATLPEGLEFIPAGRRGPDGVTSDKMRFVVTGDLEIAPENGATDLTIMPRSGARESLDTVSSGYRTSTNWSQILGQGPQIQTERSAKENQIVNDIVRDNFSTAGASDVGFNFLLEIAPSGQLDGPNGSIRWNETGVQQVEGDPKETLELFVKQDLMVQLIADNPNRDLLSNWKGDPEKIYDYLVKGGKSPSLSELDLAELSGGQISASAEPHTVSDFELTFAPTSSQGVSITSPGDVRIGANMKGHGASIKAEGQIRLTGVGFDLTAAQNEEGPAVSLYAKDDITLSTLRKTDSNSYEYSGLKLRGIIYSWKDVNLHAGHKDETQNDPQEVHIEGTIVAYGGEPGVQKPGEGLGGNLSITGDQVNLVFDPGYLVGLTGGKGLRSKLGVLSVSHR